MSTPNDILKKQLNDCASQLNGYKKEYERYREIIFKLWEILDNIDTASDVFKYNYEQFADFVYSEQRKRWSVILNDNLIDDLYEEYKK